MSTTKAPDIPEMTAGEFVVWAELRPDGERYELIDGHPVRMQSEKVSHAERKAMVWLALRTALRERSTPCAAFPDGVSVRISERRVREPDVVIHCGPYEPDDLIVPNPVVVVEVISPSSVRTDVDRKLMDYLSVPSILHYLIVYGDEGRVVHHSRQSADGPITTAILGREQILELDPPGIAVPLERFWDE